MSETPATKASSSTSNSRKRRLSYTRVACDECQRRKTKCTGERPCKACRESNHECLYERTTRFRTRRRGSLGNVMEAQGPAVPTHTQSSSVLSQHSARRELSVQERRPHSSRNVIVASPAPQNTRLPNPDYYLRLAEKLLVAPKPAQKQHAQGAGQYEPVVATQMLQQILSYRVSGSSGSPLALADMERWMAITAAYDEEVGSQYPFLDLEDLRGKIRTIIRNDPQDSHQAPSELPTESKSSHERVEEIAMHVLAIVSILADSGALKVANSWIEESYAATVVRTQLQSAVNITDLSLVILGCIFFFLSDKEVLAWRGIGNVLRLLQEHSSRCAGELTPQSVDQDAIQSEKFYWTVYTLDRRWSFGTGLPFAVQDCEIDRQPMLTDDSLSSAYLIHMVTYSQIASEVRKWMLEASSSIAACDATRDFLDFRVVQWRRNLPRKLQFDGIEDKFEPAKEKRGEYRIRLTLHLRANQMRINIHRKTTARQGFNSVGSSTIVVLTELAHDTIRILVRLAQDTDIYQAQPKTYNHFLESALSSILLALGGIDNEADRASCLNDAYEALELIQRLSTQSPASRRLLERLRNIQEAMNSFRDRSCGSTSKSASTAEGSTMLPHNSHRSKQSAGVLQTSLNSRDNLLSSNFEQNQPHQPTPGSEFTEQVVPNHSASRLGPGKSREQQQVPPNLACVSNQALPSPIVPYPQMAPDTVTGIALQSYPTASLASPDTGLVFDTSNLSVYPLNSLSFLSFPELGEFLTENGTNFSF